MTDRRRDLDELRRRLEHVRSHPPLKGWNETKEMAAARHSQNIARIEDEISQKINEAAGQVSDHRHKQFIGVRIAGIVIGALVAISIALCRANKPAATSLPVNPSVAPTISLPRQIPPSAPTQSPTTDPASQTMSEQSQRPQTEESPPLSPTP